MQGKLKVFLFIITAVLLVSGCTGTGQPDASSTSITGTPAANASKSLYAGEFTQGYEHHANASGLFNSAITLWDGEDYSGAANLLEQARGEYALAESHYHDMAAYANNAGELGFAQAMEGATADMDGATTRYLMSIDQAAADNETASLQYFQEGQELVDRSMMAINQSFDLKPSYLE